MRTLISGGTIVTPNVLLMSVDFKKANSNLQNIPFEKVAEGPISGLEVTICY